jgi:hypothetical protein
MVYSYHHHPPPRAGAIGLIVANVPGVLCPTIPQETKNENITEVYAI